jgi:NADH-quinone oxidoreductase subunit J
MEVAVFALFAALALASALVVVTHRNPVYSTMSLVVTLVSLAVLFVLLGAPFIAVLQVLIYTGAILVLFLFVIMLLNVGREEAGGGSKLSKVPALVAAALFGGMVALFSWRAFRDDALAPLTEEFVSLKTLAGALFDRYLLVFELVGLLLLVAVIAATVLARRPRPEEREPLGPRPEGESGSGSEAGAPGEAAP